MRAPESLLDDRVRTLGNREGHETRYLATDGHGDVLAAVEAIGHRGA